LREVLKLVGKVNNVRRVYYWGFHNNDPAQTTGWRRAGRTTRTVPIHHLFMPGDPNTPMLPEPLWMGHRFDN
jgi:hypothetical protein